MATIEVAKLTVPIVSDASGFAKGLKGAAKQATAWAGDMAKTVANAGLKVVQAGAVAATAAVAGLGVAIAKLAIDAAPLEGIGSAFETMASRVGLSLGDLQEASAGTISDFELMRKANVALTGAGDMLGQEFGRNLPRLLEIARAASRATGQSVDFLFESLVTGVKRGSPMLIDNTGLVLKLGEANEAMAASLGKSVDELTAEEKSVALLRATVQAGDRMVSEFGGGQLTAAEKVAKFRAQIKNAKDQMGIAFLPVLATVMDTLSGLGERVGPQLIAWAQNASEWIGARLPAAFDTVAWAVQNVRALFGRLAGAFQEGGLGGLFQQIGLEVSDVWPGIQAQLAQLGTRLVTAVGEWAAGLAPRIGEAMKGLGEFAWSWLTDRVPGLEDVATTIQPIIDTFASGFQGFLTNLAPVGPAFQDFLATVEEAAPGLRDLGEVIGTLAGGILTFVGGALPGLGEMAATLATFGLEALGNLVTLLGDLGTTLKGIFTGDVEKVQEGLKGMFSTLGEMATDVVAGTLGAAAGILDAVAGGLAALGATGLADGIAKVAEAVRGLADAIERLKVPQLPAIAGGTGLGGLSAIEIAGGAVPARQFGGPVAANAPYLVGERGPELFVPGQSGNVMSGGGPTIIENRIIIDGREMKRWINEALVEDARRRRRMAPAAL